MQVIAIGLDARTDLPVLRSVCAELALSLSAAETGADVRTLSSSEPVLCVLEAAADRESSRLAAGAANVRELGALPVAVLRSPDAARALCVAQAGYGLWLLSPLPAARLAHLLRYLRDVTPPDSATALTLDEASGTLRAGERSTPVEPDEAALLRAWAQRPGRIVTVETLPPEAAERMRAVADALRRRRLPSIGSAARVIRVPGIGYRLLGSVVVQPPEPLA